MKQHHFAQAGGLIATYIFYLSVCSITGKKMERKEKIKVLLKVNEVDSQKKWILDVEYLIH